MQISCMISEEKYQTIAGQVNNVFQTILYFKLIKYKF